MKKWLLCLFIGIFSLLTAEVVDVAILGAGPAGLTAAIYTARGGLSTIVVDGNDVGGQIALSPEVENFPGFPKGVNGFELGQEMQNQARRFGTKVVGGKIVEVSLRQRPFRMKLDNDEWIEARSVIIATDADARWLGLKSEEKFIGRGVSSCAVCDGPIYRDKEVVVVGGGDSAMEDALFLAKYAKKVTVVHRRETLRASEYLQRKAFANEKIHFIWNSVIEEITDPKKDKVTGIVIKKLSNGQKEWIEADGVFVAIGHIPNTGLFRGQIELTNAGYIIITKPFSTATNVPGVFAAGDVADFVYRQAITAAGMGSMAGLEAYSYLQRGEE